MTEYQDFPARTASHGLHSQPYTSKLSSRQVGDVLAGKYCIEHILWESKKSGVYLVNRTIKGTTVREVLKILSWGTPSQDTKKWESLISAHRRANHPNLVAIRDSDALPNSDEIYVTMDFMSEGTWAERFRQARQRGESLPLSALLPAMSGIAAAIAALHREGIIHQDIKPENMFVCPKHGAKLGDFDVAVLQQDLRRDEPTRIGGTVAYMSPEQKKAWYNRDQGGLSYATDVYSFAVSLYHLITGSFPSRRSPSLHDFIGDESLATALEHFLDRCMEENPADRYEDGATMEAAFNPIVRKVANNEDEAARIYRGAFRYVLHNTSAPDQQERDHLHQLQKELGLSELQVLRIEEAETIVHESDPPDYTPTLHTDHLPDTRPAARPRPRRRGTRLLAGVLLFGGLATAGFVSLPDYGPLSRASLLHQLNLDNDRQAVLAGFERAADTNDLDAMQRLHNDYRLNHPNDQSSLAAMERRLKTAEQRNLTIERTRRKFSDALKMNNTKLAELALEHLEALRVDTAPLRQVLDKHQRKQAKPAPTKKPKTKAKTDVSRTARHRGAKSTRTPPAKATPKPKPAVQHAVADRQEAQPEENRALTASLSQDSNTITLANHQPTSSEKAQADHPNRIALDNHPALQKSTTERQQTALDEPLEAATQTARATRRTPEQHIRQILDRVLPHRKDARALQQREIDRVQKHLHRAVAQHNVEAAGHHVTTLKLHDALGVIEKRKICSTGDDYYNRKHYRKARAWYSLLDEEPHAEIKYRLGLVHYNLNDWGNALEAFEAAYNMGFEDAQPFLDRLRNSGYQAGVHH